MHACFRIKNDVQFYSIFITDSSKLDKYVFMINMFGSCLQEVELAEKWDSELALGLVNWGITPLRGSCGTLALVQCWIQLPY